MWRSVGFWLADDSCLNRSQNRRNDALKPDVKCLSESVCAKSLRYNLQWQFGLERLKMRLLHHTDKKL